VDQSFSLANPSWGDIWYFLAYAILIISFFKLHRLFYKRDKTSLLEHLVWLFCFVALCANVIMVLPGYVLFLMLKPYGMVKSILSLLIFTNSLPFGAIVTQLWLPLFLGWQKHSKKERIFGFLIGLGGFAACLMGLVSMHFIIPKALS
jgi:hypothetical protein